MIKKDHVRIEFSRIHNDIYIEVSGFVNIAAYNFVTFSRRSNVEDLQIDILLTVASFRKECNHLGATEVGASTIRPQDSVEVEYRKLLL